jgi:hypothetical protein
MFRATGADGKLGQVRNLENPDVKATCGAPTSLRSAKTESRANLGRWLAFLAVRKTRASQELGEPTCEGDMWGTHFASLSKKLKAEPIWGGGLRFWRYARLGQVKNLENPLRFAQQKLKAGPIRCGIQDRGMLLLAQRLHRIHFGGAQRRHVARHQCRGQQYGGDRAECLDVDYTYIGEQTVHHSADEIRAA